jgi:hypothetical protein
MRRKSQIGLAWVPRIIEREKEKKRKREKEKKLGLGPIDFLTQAHL